VEAKGREVLGIKAKTAGSWMTIAGVPVSFKGGVVFDPLPPLVRIPGSCGR